MVVGTTLYLECDADGDPIPTLSWKINGKAITGTSAGGAVAVTNRISMHNENTELEIENVTVADSGESFMPLWNFSSLLRLFTLEIVFGHFGDFCGSFFLRFCHWRFSDITTSSLFG